jgi:hypothetical protein
MFNGPVNGLPQARPMKNIFFLGVQSGDKNFFQTN